LSTAGRKAELEERLRAFEAQHDSTEDAGRVSDDIEITHRPEADQNMRGVKMGQKAPHSLSVKPKLVKAGKRKNFVRLQLRVSSLTPSSFEQPCCLESFAQRSL
jgi:hypothetical protein